MGELLREDLLSFKLDISKKLAEVVAFKKSLSFLSATELLEQLKVFLEHALQYMEKYYRFSESHLKPLVEQYAPDEIFSYHSHLKCAKKPALASNLEKMQIDAFVENDRLARISLESFVWSVKALKGVVLYNIPKALQNAAYCQEFSQAKSELAEFYTRLSFTMQHAEFELKKINEHGVPPDSNPMAYRLAKAKKMEEQSDSLFDSLCPIQ